MNIKNKISVLHVTFNDVSGGAARYVMRLHNSLLNHSNISSSVLVMNKESDSSHVFEVKNSISKKFSSTIDKIPSLILNNKTKNKFSSGLFNDFVTSEIKKINPDIVHLHWVNNGMLSIKSLTKIKKPIVWSVLDMWPYTGGAHYDFQEREIHDTFLSKYLFKLKTKVYAKIDVTPIAISKWIRQGIINSGCMMGKDVKIIYPSLNLALFRPVDKTFSRKLFNLPLNKNLILFGAINSTGDPRKGFSELILAINKIDDIDFKSNTEIVVFGSSNSDFALDLDIKVNFVGKIKSDYGPFDDATLSALYSTASVTVTPSLQEAFGQVAIESMSCGVPVIAFEKTGLEDIVTNKKDGFLCKSGDIGNLAEGIIWGLENSSSLYNNCVNKANKLFDDKKTSLQLIELYKNKIKNK